MNLQRRCLYKRFLYLVCLLSVTLSSCFPAAGETAGRTPVPTSSPVKIIVEQAGSTARATAFTVVSTLTPARPVPTEVPTVAPTLAPKMDTMPVISRDVEPDLKCGRAQVVAYDGHALRATPRIIINNANFYERLPLGTTVDLIDCRFWTNREHQTWVAARTRSGKLGWLLVQPDTLAITIYPIIKNPPKALTGIPPGTVVSFVPSSKDNDAKRTGGMVTSIGIDFIPVIGDAKGVTEAITGYDLVTGESLGDWRWFGLLGLVGLAEVATLRHGDEVAKGTRFVGRLDDIARGGNRVGDTLQEVGKLGKGVDKSTDIARVVGKNGTLGDEMIGVVKKFEQPCSFRDSTPVLTPSGPRVIASIQPGEFVLAYDERLGIQDYYPVTAVAAHLDSQTLKLSIDNDEIETTSEHPFFVQGKWIAAGHLAVNDEVASASEHKGKITRIQVTPQPRVMYNLTVDRAHTYFVGAGEWLVHNACSQKLRQALGTPDWAKDGTAWQAHHIIPGEWEGHDFVRKAIDEGGWRIDGASNGIALPASAEDATRLGIPSHLGPHSNYSALVRQSLDDLQRASEADAARGLVWSGQRHANELDRLILTLRAGILKSTGRVN